MVQIIKDSLQKSFSFILTREMINVYGKKMWLEIVLKKPPWSLKGKMAMRMCKHWLIKSLLNAVQMVMQDLQEGPQNYQYVIVSLASEKRNPYRGSWATLPS